MLKAKINFGDFQKQTIFGRIKTIVLIKHSANDKHTKAWLYIFGEFQNVLHLHLQESIFSTA